MKEQNSNGLGVTIGIVALVLAVLVFGLAVDSAENSNKKENDLVRCVSTKVIPYQQCYGKKANRWCQTQYRQEKNYKWCTEQEAEFEKSAKYAPDTPPVREKDGDSAEDVIALWFFL